MKVILITMVSPCSACHIADGLLRGLFDKLAPVYPDIEFCVETLNHPSEASRIAGLEILKLPAILIDDEQITAGTLPHKRQLMGWIDLAVKNSGGLRNV